MIAEALTIGLILYTLAAAFMAWRTERSLRR